MCIRDSGLASGCVSTGLDGCTLTGGGGVIGSTLGILGVNKFPIHIVLLLFQLMF